ncbi:MAG: GIY-YIG nuclease family protein [Patescibacteria group bacterium]
MYYIYIIYSKKLNKKYAGITKNLKKRIYEHNHSKVPFTSKAKDWKLIYYEAFLNKQDAYAEEKFLKSGKGRVRLKYLL